MFHKHFLLVGLAPLVWAQRCRTYTSGWDLLIHGQTIRRAEGQEGLRAPGGVAGAWGLPGGGHHRTELRRTNRRAGRAFQVEVSCTKQAQRNDTARCASLAQLGRKAGGRCQGPGWGGRCIWVTLGSTLQVLGSLGGALSRELSRSDS